MRPVAGSAWVCPTCGGTVRSRPLVWVGRTIWHRMWVCAECLQADSIAVPGEQHAVVRDERGYWRVLALRHRDDCVR